VTQATAHDQQRVVPDIAAQIGKMAPPPGHCVRLVTVHLQLQIGQQLQGERVPQVVPAPPLARHQRALRIVCVVPHPQPSLASDPVPRRVPQHQAAMTDEHRERFQPGIGLADRDPP